MRLKLFVIISSTIALACAAIFVTLNAHGQSLSAKSGPPSAYLGFDRDLYPGDGAFSTLRKTFSFTSYWLGPPPGEKHTTWIAKRDFLRKAGFGFLALYTGRDSRKFKGPEDATAKGNQDAQRAIAAAKKEGFPAGTIIFLDIEEGGRLPPAYYAYLHTWADLLKRNGYRAGVYCSGMPASEPGGVTIRTADDIRANAAGRDFVFFVYNDACPPSPGCVFSARAPAPATSGVSYARVWQFAQSPRRKEFAAYCPPGYNPNGNCYSPNDASLAWDLDVDTATTPDPSNSNRP